MWRALRGRLLILAAILVWALWWIVPTLRVAAIDAQTREANEERWRQEDEQEPEPGGLRYVGRKLSRWWSGQGAITLGLDLRGGMHLVMEVDTDAAIANELARTKSSIENQAFEEGIQLSARSNPDEQSVIVEGDPGQADAIEALLNNIAEDRVEGADGRYQVRLPRDTANRIADLAVRQALETIRNRVDEFGVAEPVLQREGRERLLIQLPGVSDPNRVLKLIGRTAQLEFAQVYDDAPTEVELRRKQGYNISPTQRILRGKRQDSFGVDQNWQYLVDKDPILTGADLQDARVAPGQFGDYVVAFQLETDAGVRFGKWTQAHIGVPMAIILEGEVFSAPVIRDRITFNGQIEGQFTLQEAEDLAIVLRAGALPAPVRIVEQRTIGPTLGRDSIRAGVRAGLAGFVLVLAFMIVYYRLSGVIAVGALAVNILLVFAALAAFGATLTLPGIAGLILTVGMAVDGNVLIFERLREELEKGKTLRSAVDAAFERVTLTILDANLTTLVTAIVLFQFGTGPVKGFAVTLSIGILASLFTALVVTRMAYDALLTRRSVTTLTLTRLVGETHIPFLRMRLVSIGASILLLLVGAGRFYQLGPANFGIDFTQGTVVQAKFTPAQAVGDVRSALESAGIHRATVQRIDQPGEDAEVLIRTAFVDASEAGDEETEVLHLTGQQVEQALQAAFGAEAVEILRTEEVGAAVSRDLTRDAIFALVYSMGAIVLYISFRFEFRFAIAAVIALLHDVGITMGMFALTRHEISLPVVAALLTVVGYSLNDTIVVFDRIRENQKLHRKMAVENLLDVSINETLSRTLLTSLTTFFVLIVLYIAGGSVIHDFAFALLIGIVVGTYSSIFIASPIVLMWERWRPTRGRPATANATDKRAAAAS